MSGYKAANTFDTARRNLDELMSGLTFLKVVCVQRTGTGAGASYTGEAVEVLGNGQQKRLAFFDKFGRNRSFLTLGPITLSQAAMGFDHASSVPSVGEILVGTLVANTRKSHLAHVLRGWSSDAKPLQELARILRHGTKRSEFENRDILMQPAGLLPSTSSHISCYRDEIYMLARVVLWGNLRPLQVLASVQDPLIELKVPASEAEKLAAKTVKISQAAKAFVETITVKLSCSDIMEAFDAGVTYKPEPPKFALENPYSKYRTSSLFVLPSRGAAGPSGPPVAPCTPAPAGYYDEGPVGPEAPELYSPTAAGPVAPSRLYEPHSPIEGPQAACGAAGGEAAGAAPAPYVPSSPVYGEAAEAAGAAGSGAERPPSPYNPTSPVYDQMDDA